MSIVNKLNLLKYSDILDVTDDQSQGRMSHIRVRLATGSGTDTAMTGFALPATYEASDFTPQTAAHTDPKAREFVERHEAVLHAHRAIGHVAALSAASLSVGKDSSLSASGRDQKLRGAVADTIGKLGTHLAAIDPIDAALKVTETKLLTPPEPDFAATLLDNEARNHWRGLDLKDRFVELKTRLGSDPKLDRMLLALRRSPVPLGSDESEVNQAWRSMVARTQPDAWKAFSDARAATDWSAGLITQLAKHTLSPSGRDRVDRMTLYKVLKPTGAGLRLGNFQSYEIGSFEHQLAASAAA